MSTKQHKNSVKTQYRPDITNLDFELVIAGAILHCALTDIEKSKNRACRAAAWYWLLYGDGAHIAEIIDAENYVAESLAVNTPPVECPPGELPSAIKLAKVAAAEWCIEPQQLEMLLESL